MSTPGATGESPNTNLQNIEAELDKFAQRWANLRDAGQYELVAEATTEAAQQLAQLCSSRELAGRIDTVKRIWGHAREHTITDIELIAHQTGGKVDFIEAVDTQHLEDELTRLEALKKKEK